MLAFPSNHYKALNGLVKAAILFSAYEVYWITLEDMKKKKLAYGMDKMLEVFLDDNISEYFFYKEDGKWVEELK